MACAACVSVIFDSLQEFSVNFGNGRERGKRIGILVQDALHFPDLALADDAYKHRLIKVGIHTRRVQFRYAMMQPLHDLFSDLLGMIGDDLKAERRFETTQDRIARFARYKQGYERKKHGIKLFGKRRALMIHKKGCQHNARVEHGGHCADA